MYCERSEAGAFRHDCGKATESTFQYSKIEALLRSMGTRPSASLGEIMSVFMELKVCMK